MMNRIRLFLSILLALFIGTSSAQTKLKTGTWRGILTNESKHQLPFNFEVSNVGDKQQIAIINGTEHYQVPDVTTTADSVFVKMPLFDSEFRLKLGDDHLSGHWIRHLGDHDSALPFTATANTSWRFSKNVEKPAYNISGRWAAVFGEGTDGRDELVGEFKQDGNKLTGTFLSTTGDYRYLEGSVSGDRMYLSCFDGCHAFIFTAKIKDGNTLVDGENYSGYSAFTKWTAVKNANAKLPDAYALTALKPGIKKIDFTFPDIDGKKVSLSDDRFKNKVVIVQMLGSWCPNCMDETNFIVNGGYYKKYHPKGVEVIGLAYERTTDFKKSQKTLAQLKDHFNIPYPLLITGYTPSKGDPMKSLPQLADFKGFPTTIIIDKKGNVRKIHTGFNGPGTGNHYTEFIVEFDKLTEDLLAEKG